MVCIYSERELLRLSPEHRRLVVDPDRPYGFGLQMVQDPDYPERSRCALLVGEVGVDAKCSIHDHKPVTCKIYIPGVLGCVESRAKYPSKFDSAPLMRDGAKDQTSEFIVDYRDAIGIPARPRYMTDEELREFGGDWLSWVEDKRRRERRLPILDQESMDDPVRGAADNMIAGLPALVEAG